MVLWSRFSFAFLALSHVVNGVALAPLEPSAGHIYFGAWYDRNNSDTPAQINKRMHKPLAFFQTDIDFSGVEKPWTAPNITDQFIRQLDETKTDAIAFLTVYPFQGMGSNITDAQIADMATRLNALVNSGRRVFFRFAPEMNGNWFNYGQDPQVFKDTWIRCITYWRKELKSNIDKVAFIWAPNSGNGYPYPGGLSAPNPDNPNDAPRLALLDTNGNGKFDSEDDPYYPYYPGDEYVDWVGISIYHYGQQWPWIQNSIPEPNKFEGYLQGNVKPDWGTKPFYTYFSSPTGVRDNLTNAVISAGNKPFIVPETGATYHFAWVEPRASTEKYGSAAPNQTTTRIQVKEAWWKSFLNPEFVAKYPKIKAVGTFEFIKSEEDTWRDFSNLGAAFNPAADLATFESDNNAVAAAFVRDAKEMDFLVWANETGAVATTTKTSSAVKGIAGTFGVIVVMSFVFGFVL